MWIDKLTLIMIIVLCVIVFIYELNLKNKKYDKLVDEYNQLEKRKNKAIDECYARMKNEQKEIILSELQFFLGCDATCAEDYYNILDETAMTNEFFSAQTSEERHKVLTKAERQKKYLNNDINVLIEDLYLDIVASVEGITRYYANWNKFAKLNLVMFYFVTCYEKVRDLGKRECLLDFQDKFKTIFVKNAIEVYSFEQSEAICFFEERVEVYKRFLNESTEYGFEKAAQATKAYLIDQKDIDCVENNMDEILVRDVISEIESVYRSISQEPQVVYLIDKICKEYSKD